MTSLSVALATRDGAAHVDAQLDSLAAQTRRPDELVVVDDGSTDDTVARVEAFAAGAPFPVHLHRRPAPGGVHAAFGAALAATTGDLVALCDQDDVWAPGRLARLGAAVGPPDAVALAFCDARLVDGAGAPLGGTAWDLLAFGRRARRRFGRDPLGRLLVAAASPGCTMVATRAAVDAALPLPSVLAAPEHPLLHDRWLSLVAAALGTVTPVAVVLGDYRRHGGQASGARTVGAARRAQVARAGAQLRPAAPAGPRLARRADQVAALADRVAALGGPAATVARLRAVAAHLGDRAALPAARRARLAPVARAARAGRYRAAGGVAGVAADLLRPLPPGGDR